MATKPKIDAETDNAMKAVEDALDIELTADDLDLASDNALAGDEEMFLELERRLTDAANELKSRPEQAAASPSERLNASGREAESGKRANSTEPLQTLPNAANDDRRNTVAELVYSLQRKPSRMPLAVSSILSVLWVVAVGLYGQNAHPELFSPGIPVAQKMARPDTYLLAGIAIIPVLLLFAFAVMSRRAQEMRLAAGSMTQAAIRLMQPESIAVDSISTVGRAIRREVAGKYKNMKMQG